MCVPQFTYASPISATWEASTDKNPRLRLNFFNFIALLSPDRSSTRNDNGRISSHLTADLDILEEDSFGQPMMVGKIITLLQEKRYELESQPKITSENKTDHQPDEVNPLTP